MFGGKESGPLSVLKRLYWVAVLRPLWECLRTLNKTGAGSVGVLMVGSLSGEAYPQALSLVAKEIKVGISSWSWASSG